MAALGERNEARDRTQSPQQSQWRKTVIRAVLLLLCFFLHSWASRANAQQYWPAWRGPYGNGLCGEPGVPLVWSEARNKKFRSEIPGEGASSPIVWNDAIFVTSQAGVSLLLLRINKQDGAIVWQQEVGRATTPRETAPGRQIFHESHNLASPTPTTDGVTVIASFGNGLLAAYDFDGNQIWKRDLQQDYGRFSFRYGYATSPILFEGVVISACLQRDLTGASDKAAAPMLVAHDKQTGHLKWRTVRHPEASGEGAEVYGTPALRKTGTGEIELIVTGGGVIDAYNPADGTRRWAFKQPLGGRSVCSPTIVGGSLVGMRKTAELFVLEMPTQATAEVETLNRRKYTWSVATAVPETCSPVAWGDMLFTITDDGQATCYDGVSGRRYWRQQLEGTYRASPVAADGRVYFLNEAGLCTVVGASTKFDRLAENKLDAQTQASIAISNNELLIRGRKALYCLTRY